VEVAILGTTIHLTEPGAWSKPRDDNSIGAADLMQAVFRDHI
jgi:hypothetical protein